MTADVKRRAHEAIYRTLDRCIETMDLPATYKAAVTVRILMDLEAAGIGMHWQERQGAKKRRARRPWSNQRQKNFDLAISTNRIFLETPPL